MALTSDMDIEQWSLKLSPFGLLLFKGFSNRHKNQIFKYSMNLKIEENKVTLTMIVMSSDSTKRSFLVGSLRSNSRAGPDWIKTGF